MRSIIYQEREKESNRERTLLKVNQIMKKASLKKKPPYPFVLEELADLEVYTKPMFGCTGIYLDDKIVLILRDRDDEPKDSGAWVATTPEHHESLKRDLPSMRSIYMFGPGPTGWQNLPRSSPRFEDDVLRACALVRKRDPRIGKVPKARKKTPKRAAASGAARKTADKRKRK